MRRRGPVRAVGWWLAFAFALAPWFTSAPMAGASPPAAAARHAGQPAQPSQLAQPAQAPVFGQWYTNSDSLAELVKLAPTVAAEFYDRPDSYGWIWAIPDGWSTTPYVNYGSYARFAADLQNGTVPHVQMLMYDPELWYVDRRTGTPSSHHGGPHQGSPAQPEHELQQGERNPAQIVTPLAEQQHPDVYLPKFVDLAHANGYSVIEAPGVNLVNVPGADCRRRDGEIAIAAFLRCGLAGAAGTADAIDIQFQQEECSTPLYRRDVYAARRQARAANPDIAVLSGLTTGWCRPTGNQIFAAEEAVRNFTDGHFLAIGNAAMPAVNFLSRLAPVIVGAPTFSPAPQVQAQGATASWRISWDAKGSHSVTDEMGLGLFDSGLQPPGTVFRHTFAAAGTYTATDRANGSSGDIQVPVLVWPAWGDVHRTYTVRAAPAAAPTGYVYETEVQRPGSGAWSMWRTGGVNGFTPDSGVGQYSFRSRLRRKSNGAFSGWSPPATIHAH
jgi:hypothetical protein